MRNRLLTTALCAGLCTAACGTGPTASDDGPSSHLPSHPQRGGRELVLRMTYGPGFAPVPERAPLPAFSLYDDGRVVTAQTRPGAPARAGGWQRARELRTGDEGMRRLLRAARAAGLDDAPSEPSEPTGNPVPDASSALFTLYGKDGGRHALKVTLPEGSDDARGELFDALSDPARWLGGDARTRPYRSEAIAVLRGDEPAPVPEARRWPLGPLDFPGTRLGTGQRAVTCTVLRAGRAARLTERAADAPQRAQWTDGRHSATLELRPLLPDEEDCRDLPQV